MVTAAVGVSGMTCGACATKGSTAIGALDGVTDVSADPATGTVLATAETLVDPTTIRGVVDPIGSQVRV
ncbi:heavy-metal-associated domain-containing protein [Nocardia noduli]|uniref:heavy-metal-associated domain-containing protein n=1 Tax=Nocardia noduli TaxID=2815722 RepID=UPI001C2232F2|nr:heavy-metal-associated domain-containing protein [Nocardia noduli]